MGKLIFALVMFLAAPVWAAENMRQITVIGQGHVDTVPDMATITLGVVSEGKTAAIALSENSQSLAKILVLLKQAGIEERDIQTRNLSLSPRWNNRSSKSGPPEIIGFIARNTVSVRVRDLDKLGEVLDASVKTGANSFQGLGFGLQQPASAQNQARQNAVKDAVAKARLYADAAGVKLGKVIIITESARQGGGPVAYARMAEMDSAPVPVARGEISTTSSVTMVFEIAD